MRQNDEKDIGTKEVGRERRARNGRAGKSAGKRDSVRAGGMSRRGKGTVPWGRRACSRGGRGRPGRGNARCHHAKMEAMGDGSSGGSPGERPAEGSEIG